MSSWVMMNKEEYKMQKPCLAEKTAEPEELSRMAWFKWAVLALLLLLLLLRSCGSSLNAPVFITPSSGIIKSGAIKFTGMGEPNSTIELLQDGAHVQKTVADDNGNWSVNSTIKKAGRYGFIAQTLGKNGHAVASSDQIWLTVPNPVMSGIAPKVAIPSVTTPQVVTPRMATQDAIPAVVTPNIATPNATIPSITTSKGKLTATDKDCSDGKNCKATIMPTIVTPKAGIFEVGETGFSGTGQPASMIKITQNGYFIGKTTVNRQGNWATRIPLTMPGKYVLTAQALDDHENAIGSSNQVWVTIRETSTDSDHDGISDIADKCPGTLSGHKVDINGCVTEKDADGDTIIDDVDKCPNTPKGVAVDKTGCTPSLDTDKDGVPDIKDICPTTQSGIKVGLLGCAETGTIVLDGVNFKTNSAELTPNSSNILDKVVKSLRQVPSMKLEVAGHTDASGAALSNQVLSQKRAETVVRYFKERNIDTSGMTAKGYGESKPIADNKTKEGKAKNRRVELNRQQSIASTKMLDSSANAVNPATVKPAPAPITVTQATVDTNADADKDGVKDVNDKCPNTMTGDNVDTRGCVFDSDNDGIDDTTDKCPNTPEGASIDDTGCMFDSDNDGVVNARDLCPDTQAGANVDKLGCAKTSAIVLKGVNFKTNSDELTFESSIILDKVAQSLASTSTSGLRFEVAGHTDSSGSAPSNQKLSQKRAEAVVRYLKDKGVNTSSITAKGYGESKPIADNNTEAGKAKNRRVELNRL